jgi:acetyl esterase/lipase
MIAAVALIACAVASVSGQDSDAGDWTAEVMAEYGFTQTDITYGRAGGVDLKLDVYRPQRRIAGTRLPTLVWIHGGGWRRGSKESYALRVLPWLEMGWGVVNVEYRLSKAARAPGAVEDCRCALRWVIANAEKYGFDPDRIVVSGQSAGGHLALMTGLAADEAAFDANCPGPKTRVAAVVNWFGITDVADLLAGPNRTEFATEWIGADRLGDAGLIARVSPLSYVRGGLPPVITVHGDKDPLVPYQHAVRLHDALGRAGVANRLVTVAGGDHGDFSKKDSVRAYREIRKFLKKFGLVRVSGG